MEAQVPVEKEMLSSDLITDILCRLPLKDLLRFRCLSKPWCSSIDDPDFIKHHLNRNPNLSVLMQSLDRRIYSINPDARDMNAVELDDPLKRSSYGFTDARVVGICNGLVALWSNMDNRFALWNPSTRERKVFPSYDRQNNKFISNTILGTGLGYDALNEDYKILMIDRGLLTKGMEIMVYSLRNDFWRACREDFFSFIPQYEDVRFQETNGSSYCNGALHWALLYTSGERRRKLMIVAFDIENEEFREVPMPVPKPDAESNPKSVNLSVNGGCLRWIQSHLCSDSMEKIEVWEMKEYGKEESWVRMLCFSPIFYGYPWSVIGDSIVLLGKHFVFWYKFWKNGHINKVEFVSSSAKRFETDRMDVPLSFYYYTASLVSIKAISG